MKLFYIPVGAADFVCVWSTSLFTISKTRTRMDMNRVVECVQLKTHIYLSHEEELLQKRNKLENITEHTPAISLALGSDAECVILDVHQECDPNATVTSRTNDKLSFSFSNVSDALQTEDIERLVDRYLGDSETIAMPPFSSADMEAIMSGSTPSNKPTKKNLFQGIARWELSWMRILT